MDLCLVDDQNFYFHYLLEVKNLNSSSHFCYTSHMNNKIKLLILFTSTAAASSLTTSCAIFERNQDSGYSTVRPTKGNFKVSSKDSNKQVLDSKLTMEDLKNYTGLQNSSVLKGKLRTLENSISSKKEVEQYSKYLPWFESEQEKINFLSLPGFEAKQDWINENKLMNRNSDKVSEMKDVIDAQDISLGMPQDLVKKSWGDPDAVDVSGNPQFKNERWRYNKYVSTQDGYKLEKKLVYFEGGKVVGWEVE